MIVGGDDESAQRRTRVEGAGLGEHVAVGIGVDVAEGQAAALAADAQRPGQRRIDAGGHQDLVEQTAGDAVGFGQTGPVRDDDPLEFEVGVPGEDRAHGAGPGEGRSLSFDRQADVFEQDLGTEVVAPRVDVGDDVGEWLRADRRNVGRAFRFHSDHRSADGDAPVGEELAEDVCRLNGRIRSCGPEGERWIGLAPVDVALVDGERRQRP